MFEKEMRYWTEEHPAEVAILLYVGIFSQVGCTIIRLYKSILAL